MSQSCIVVVVAEVVVTGIGVPAWLVGVIVMGRVVVAGVVFRCTSAVRLPSNILHFISQVFTLGVTRVVRSFLVSLLLLGFTALFTP